MGTGRRAENWTSTADCLCLHFSGRWVHCFSQAPEEPPEAPTQRG